MSTPGVADERVIDVPLATGQALGKGDGTGAAALRRCVAFTVALVWVVFAASIAQARSCVPVAVTATQVALAIVTI